MSAFKLIRVVALLSILFVLLVSTWMNERRLASWERPVWVTIYPITVEADPSTHAYIRQIDERSFDGINKFFERDLSLYGISLTPPFHFQIAPLTDELPPLIPTRHSTFSIALWSLKMRWWAWRMDRNDGLISSDIQMFVVYHVVGGESEMSVSVGMRKGMYGLVKGYASKQMSDRNQVVIAHELLHTLGASDKYVFSSGDPEYPFGYAEPDKRPLFPQQQAEIMGGRIPLSAIHSIEPGSLLKCRIGHKTAEEIGLFAQLEQHE